LHGQKQVILFNDKAKVKVNQKTTYKNNAGCFRTDSNVEPISLLPLELPCKNNCCQIKYLPLSLAWAKTGHTFQRQSTGQG
jgi:hypothetical protein